MKINRKREEKHGNKKETSFSGLEKEGNELFNINHSFELEKDGISTFLGIGVSDVVWEIMRT